jgi:UDP-glucose 4-epimerase
MAKILITGGAGFIGSHLAEFLCKDHEVTILDNLDTGYLKNIKDLDVKFIHGDIRNSNLVDQLIEGKDYVFHLASVTSVPESIKDPDKTFSVCLNGSLNVLKSCVTHKVKKIVFSSSAAIYGDDPELPKHEGMLPEPISPYGVAKVAVEHLLKTYHQVYDLSYANLRYFNVFGPKQDPKSAYSGVISIFFDKALNDEPISINGDGAITRDFIYVSDVVKANWMAALSEKTGTFNVGTGKRVSILDMAKRIIEITSSDSQITFGPPREGDILHSVCSIAKIQEHLNWAPEIEFKEGLKSTIDFFKL